MMHARRNTGDVAASPALDTDTFGQPQIAAIEIQDPSVRCLIRVLSDRLNCPDQCIGVLCDHGAHDTGKPLRRQSHVIVDKRDQRCLRCSYTGIARICDISSGLMYISDSCCRLGCQRLYEIRSSRFGAVVHNNDLERETVLRAECKTAKHGLFQLLYAPECTNYDTNVRHTHAFVPDEQPSAV